MWKHLKNKESFFKVTDQIPQATLGNRTLLDRIPSSAVFCMHLTGPILLCCSMSSPKHRSCRIGSKKRLEGKKLVCTILPSDSRLECLHSWWSLGHRVQGHSSRVYSCTSKYDMPKGAYWDPVWATLLHRETWHRRKHGWGTLEGQEDSGYYTGL